MPDGDPDAYEADDYWYPGPLPAAWQAAPGATWLSAPTSGYAEPQASAEPPTRIEPTGPAAPVVGPTAALRGRAGGPGFIVQPHLVPPGHAPVGDGARSGWQEAQGVWSGSGILWDSLAAPVPPAAPGHAEQAFAASASPDYGFPGIQAFASAPTMADAPPSAGTVLTYPDDVLPPAADTATTRIDGLAVAGTPDQSVSGTGALPPEAVVPGASVPTGEAGERFRAWNDSVRQASAAPGSPARRRKTAGNVAWDAVRVGVPVAIIVTVGAGAYMMLTGQPGEMLGQSTGQTRPAYARVHAGTRITPDPGSGSGQALGFGGYPGQRGAVTVSAFAAAGGTQLAVGGADGHPAIWRRGSTGAWSLVSAGQPPVSAVPGMASLASVAVGRAGWIAVGETSGGHPVLVTSADGVTWHSVVGTDAGAFTAPGLNVTGVAAGGGGYVVVGQQVAGPRRFAAMWWSPDLVHWMRADNGHLNGRLASSAVHAVTATAAGFTAVGTHSGQPMIWTTRTGQSWVPRDLPLPVGATSAALRFAAASGGTEVAAGEAATGHGAVPFVLVSNGAGQEWRQVMLPAPGGGTVTALTASGSGFVAAGLAGPSGGQHTVTWTSPDGITWSASTPASSTSASPGE